MSQGEVCSHPVTPHSLAGGRDGGEEGGEGPHHGAGRLHGGADHGGALGLQGPILPRQLWRKVVEHIHKKILQ